MVPESVERAVNSYYESVAALRLVSSELGTLRLLADAEPGVAGAADAAPRPLDAAAGLMAAFDRALGALLPGYPINDAEGRDFAVVRRALEFEVGAIVAALTPSTERVNARP